MGSCHPCRGVSPRRPTHAHRNHSFSRHLVGLHRATHLAVQATEATADTARGSSGGPGSRGSSGRRRVASSLLQALSHKLFCSHAHAPRMSPHPFPCRIFVLRMQSDRNEVRKLPPSPPCMSNANTHHIASIRGDCGCHTVGQHVVQ
jgi:hypothetical protein